MKRLLTFVGDAWCYAAYAYFLMNRLVGGQDEVEMIFRKGRSELRIYFDPLTVKGETRIVEDLLEDQGVREESVRFLRSGKLHRDPKNEAAYLGEQRVTLDEEHPVPAFVRCARCPAGMLSAVSAELHDGLCWKCWYELRVSDEEKKDDDVFF